ncbi:MAG TPA: inorganic phosphate transporter [Longimicrobiales bacterium]|nr:inorganic phosphate transporter [Longimicrobiales bacterium]
MDIGTGVLLTTLVGGAYMAWNIGANDVANAMGTSVGSGALTLKRAIILAAIFEFLGAVLVGSHVTDTIRKGIVEVSLFAPTGPAGADGPLLLALGMLAALISAGAWLNVATHFALPVSTTHSIVGAVVGIGVATFGLAGVDWGTMLEIVLSWFASPAMGAAIAFFMFIFIRRRILEDDDPAAASRRIGPMLVGLVTTIIFLSFLYKTLSNVIDAPPFGLALGISLALGVVGALASRPLIAKADRREGKPYEHVERMFAVLQVATAIFVAFAHGANDVANAVGPLASVVTLARTGFTEIATTVPVPFWVLLLGGVGIVVGLATLGYRVIETVGKQITEMTPTRGFSAEFGAATTVLIASRLGIPVSTTHTLVGGVIGVGMAQGMAALNMRVVRNIIVSWLATVPIAAGFSMVIYLIMRAIVF